jgi:hypothetical protein
MKTIILKRAATMPRVKDKEAGISVVLSFLSSGPGNPHFLFDRTSGIGLASVLASEELHDIN